MHLCPRRRLHIEGLHCYATRCNGLYCTVTSRLVIHSRIPGALEETLTYVCCLLKGRHVMQAVLCLMALAAVHAAAQPFMPGQGLLPLGDGFLSA